MKTWFEPREVLFTFGELDLGIRTLVADFEFWPQVVDFGFWNTSGRCRILDTSGRF